jgi:hypothetical protein
MDDGQVLLVGSGAHAEAIAERLAGDGFAVTRARPDADAETLGPTDDASTPWGLVVALEEDFGADSGDCAWDAEWLAGLSERLHTVYAQTRALARPMMRARRGRIVFVVASDGLRGGDANGALTVGSAAIAGMARCVARELAGRSVLVNTVAYGRTAEDGNPLGRAVLPEEVAAIVSRLVSDEVTGVCGQVWAVDGGLVMR